MILDIPKIRKTAIFGGLILGGALWILLFFGKQATVCWQSWFSPYFSLSPEQIRAAEIFPWGITNSAECPRLVLSIFIDILGMTAGYSLLVTLFSQFVLPVYTPIERQKARAHFLAFIAGSYGPVMFVENGKKRARNNEEERKGPGVIVVDRASAIALRTKTKAKGTYAPGVVFTQPGEVIKEPIIDLRKQVRSAEVEGTTKDGFRVKATLQVEFMVERENGLRAGELRIRKHANRRLSAGKPYAFAETPTFLAIYGSVVNQNYNEEQWDKLPMLVAKDAFQGLLARYNGVELLPHFEKVYFSSPTAPIAEEMPRLWAEFEKQLNQLFGIGQPALASPANEGYTLEQRGVRMLRVSLRDIQLDAKLNDELKTQWKEWFPKKIGEGFKSPSHIDEIQKAVAQQVRLQILDTHLAVFKNARTFELDVDRKRWLAKEMVEASLHLLDVLPEVKDKDSLRQKMFAKFRQNSPVSEAAPAQKDGAK